MTVSSVAQSGLAVSKEIKTMGIYDKTNPGRAGADVAKYDNWPMALIIKDFIVDKPPLDEYTRLQLRRAILVSREFNNVSNGVRFNV
jgi:hypothetical protein